MKTISFVLVLCMLMLVSCDDYSVRLLKQLSYESPEDNILLSPLNFVKMITLLANGAKDETQKELLQVIRQPDVISANKKIEEYMQIFEGNNEVVTVNGFITKYSPNENFVNKATLFNIDVEPLQHVDQVNKWCKTKTSGKIDNIIDKTHHIDLMVINAITFKGLLKYKFDLSYIRQGVFFSPKGNQFAQMMSMTVEARFYQNWNEQIIELPYDDNDLVVTIILPKRGIDTFVDQLRNKINVFKGIGINKAKVHLTVPKFTVNYATSLVDIMKTLETDKPFDKKKSDFSMITQHNKIFIDEYMHANVFEFTEEGAEPALKTPAGIDFLSEPDILESKNPVMLVNKPFILLVQHKEITDHDLLFGKITTLI